MNQSSGKVYLVGAGPGDPGLLTLRGAECLREADVVLYDYLASPELLVLDAARRRADLPRPPRPRPADVADRNQRRDDTPRLARPHRRAAQRAAIRRSSPGWPRNSTRSNAAGVPYEIVPGVTAAPGRQQPRRHSAHRSRRSVVRRVRDRPGVQRQTARPNRSTTPPWRSSPARSCSTWALRPPRIGAARSSSTASRRTRRWPSCGAARCPIRKRFSRRSANCRRCCKRKSCARRPS